MKSLRSFALVGFFVFGFISVTGISFAAPALPVTKPQVISPYLTGPILDPTAAQGQWFFDLGSKVEEPRSHEFHDNVIDFGGGNASFQAIRGYVSNVTTGLQGEITAFDITAIIVNDTAMENTIWSASTNSHDEVRPLDLESFYYGMMKDTKLTAEFAISTNYLGSPTNWVSPYIPSVGADIIAVNEDQLAWYCWSPEVEEQFGDPGDYHVPTWDFGDIPVGGSSTRVLQFTTSLGGIPTSDLRNMVIMDSFTGGFDILLNRTTSLKVSTWIDTLANDTGAPYPHEEGGNPARSSDVSVFHDVAVDFGDAPDSYKTTLAVDGARHMIRGPWLGDVPGSSPDPETDGQPDSNAQGDDNDGFDDERGVWIATNTKLITGVPTTYSMEVNGSPGWFQMWIDWDANGTFDHPIEMVTNVYLNPGQYTPQITAPLHAVPTNTFIRCRISSLGSLTPTGAADDGEVEDHALAVENGYVNWGELQHPSSTTTYIGTPTDKIYGRCYHPGLTPPSSNQAPGLIAQLGYGPDGSDSPWDVNWTWVSTTFNAHNDPAQINDDEYVGELTINSPGTYDYAYRYSLNGIEWTYADVDPGSSDGYTNTMAGDLIVTALPPFSITNVTLVATSDTATVSWPAESRVVYQLQYVTELPTNTPPWSNIGGEVTGNTQTDTTATTTRFYRVVAPYAN